ncbi:hypothetical protein [Brunnivagina elsteri]|uniref:hypothetical protein n=1 Tax=Brunnivagina elsteri TaxID=1247191 RepID=UPI00130474E0|nr:hypothetical protein [Calothrix elsteri]
MTKVQFLPVGSINLTGSKVAIAVNKFSIIWSFCVDLALARNRVSLETRFL